MKIIITENKLEKSSIHWLIKNYGDLESSENTHPFYVVYKKGDKVIFAYNERYNKVYISYDEIWSFFEKFFGMEYEQIQDIIKKWVKENYKLKISQVHWTDTF